MINEPMAFLSIRSKILIIFLGVGLLTTPFFPVALGAGMPTAVLSSLCGQELEPGTCCECCDTCDDFAGVGGCLALCFTTDALPTAAPSILASQIYSDAHLFRDSWIQHLTAPEPGPPKQTVLL